MPPTLAGGNGYAADGLFKQQAGRWDRYHYVRVGVIVLAFALYAAALSR
jgi:hypothetical protein